MKRNFVIVVLLSFICLTSWQLIVLNNRLKLSRQSNVSHYDGLQEDAIRDMYKDYKPCICPMVINRYNSYYAVGIGVGVEVAGNGPVAVGVEAKAFGDGAIAIGNFAIACGEKAVAFGDWTCAVGSGVEDIDLSFTDNKRLVNFLQSDLTMFSRSVVFDVIDYGLIPEGIPFIDNRKK